MSGARLTITSDISTGVVGADFLYTDVWLRTTAPTTVWDERISKLLPYQVNAGVMTATGNPAVKFMHPLPSLHDTQTDIGHQVHERYGLEALEVTEEVFESPASIVLDQAANRMHTIKALMVATPGSMQNLIADLPYRPNPGTTGLSTSVTGEVCPLNLRRAKSGCIRQRWSHPGGNGSPKGR